MNQTKKWELLLAPLATDEQLFRALMYAVGKASQSDTSARLQGHLDKAWDAFEAVQLMTSSKEGATR